MNKGGLWRCDNPYHTNPNKLCKKMKIKNKDYYVNNDNCILKCLEKRKKYIVLIVGENHIIGTSNLDNLLELAFNNKITLFLEGSLKYYGKSTLDISEKMIMDNSYDNIHFLDRRFGYLFSYILQIRERISYLDFIEKIPENQKEIDEDFQELSLHFFYFLINFYLFYYKYVNFFIERSPIIFNIIKDNYEPLLNRKNMEKNYSKSFKLIGIITSKILSKFNINIFKKEMNNLIKMCVLSTFGPFDNIRLPSSISLSKLLNSYNNEKLFTSSYNYYKYWQEINLFIRDLNFAKLINDKKSKDMPNVIICGFFHTHGIKENLLKMNNKIYPVIVDNKYILKAIRYYS